MQTRKRWEKTASRISNQNPYTDRIRGEGLPVLLEEAVVVKVVLEFLELLGLTRVEPFLRLGLLVGVDPGGEGRRFEGLRLRRQVPEAALDVVPLRGCPLHVLVHEVVIRHERVQRERDAQAARGGERRENRRRRSGRGSEGTRNKNRARLTCGPHFQWRRQLLAAPRSRSEVAGRWGPRVGERASNFAAAYKDSSSLRPAPSSPSRPPLQSRTEASELAKPLDLAPARRSGARAEAARAR
jgi:hypothetical protein